MGDDTRLLGRPVWRGLSALPGNVWAVSLTSFLMDISSEMVLNVLPLYLVAVLGARTSLVGLIEGLSEATASLLKACSGWLSDRLGARKWLAVAGYGLSAAAKPLFAVAGTWGVVLAARWGDRVGKGVRTAPRDALVADSVADTKRGLAFGVHRAADTGGAVVGLAVALGIVLAGRAGGLGLSRSTFQTLALASLVPAGLAVLTLATLAHDVRVAGRASVPRMTFRGLGRPFLLFMVIVGLFDLGNSSDAFLVLRARERGLGLAEILGMLMTFNLVYAFLSAPAGALSDRIGRHRVIVGGWLVYAAIYLGFALARAGWHVWALYGAYGAYYGLAYGTTKALVADLVPAHLRGTAFGTYNTVLGLLDFPASLIAGVLWQGLGAWHGLGPSAPFAFGAVMSLVAAVLLLAWRPVGRAATRHTGRGAQAAELGP